MTTLAKKREELKTHQEALHKVFAEAGLEHSAGGNDDDHGRLDFAEVKSLDPKFSTEVEKAVEVKRMIKEIDGLGTEVDDLAVIETKARELRAAGDETDPKKRGSETTHRHASEHETKQQIVAVNLGELFMESKAYKGYDNGSGIGPQATLDGVELKTLFQTSAGWAIENLRSGRLVLDEQRPIAVVDIFPQTTTNQAAIVYMEETTFTNAAAEAAEAGTYAESALALTERTNTVRKIATFLPVTDEQLADEPRSRDYVNNRLIFMLRQRLDSQLIAGDGIAPNLEGVLNVTGINSQAKGADSVPDAVYKGIDLCRVNGFAEPDVALFHPTDWQGVRLLKTADGIYIWGAPMDAGPARIWGLPVVLSTAVTLNTAVVGAFREFSELSARSGVDVQVSNSHSTYFIEGKLAIRADVRVAAVFYRAKAFAEITGI